MNTEHTVPFKRCKGSSYSNKISNRCLLRCLEGL